MNSIFGAARKPKTCYTKVGAARKPKTCYTKVGAARKPKLAIQKSVQLANRGLLWKALTHCWISSTQKEWSNHFDGFQANIRQQNRRL